MLEVRKVQRSEKHDGLGENAVVHGKDANGLN